MKIYGHLSSLVLFFVVLTSATAQDNSLLYQVSKPGMETSYLFGTIHLMPQDQFKMSESVSDAFAKAEKILLELDMDDPGLQGSMMKELMFTDGSTLSELFTEEERTMIDSVLTKKLGMNLAAFNTMKPFAINAMLLPTFMGKQIASYEATFIQMAGAQKKEILGLESVQDQFDAINAQTLEEQADEIVEYIQESDEMQKLFDKMLELYLEGNPDKIYKMTQEYYDGDQEMITSMLDNRNKSWIPVLNEQFAAGSRFVGVGAAHLGGENGVINLLRNEGYKVIPLK